MALLQIQEHLGVDSRADFTRSDNGSWDSVTSRLLRECSVIGGGTLKGIGDDLSATLNKPWPVVLEIGTAAAAGYGLARMQGGSNMLKFGAQIAGAGMTWSFCKDLAGRTGAVFNAACDTWNSSQNTQQNKQIVAGAMGPFVVDTAATLLPGLAGAKWGANANAFDGMRTSLEKASHDGIFLVYVDNIGTGTGFPLDRQGLIGTAFHVAEVSPELTLRNLEGRHLIGRPIAGLPGADVALLQADMTGSKPLVPWELDTADIKAGKPFKGAALGIADLRMRVEAGFLKHGDNRASSQMDYLSNGESVAIARPDSQLYGLRALGGMSGGPVVNERQKVVGVVIAEFEGFTHQLLGDGGVHAPVNHLAKLMSYVERARVPGAAVDVSEASGRLGMTPQAVINGLHKGTLEGFVVPQQAQPSAAFNSGLRPAGDLVAAKANAAKATANVNWEWRVLLDKK